MTTEMTPRETEIRAKAEIAKSMECDKHRDGVVHYRPVYDSFECHTYRDRILFTHVVAYAEN
jgi:hypothetical protein